MNPEVIALISAGSVTASKLIGFLVMQVVNLSKKDRSVLTDEERLIIKSIKDDHKELKELLKQLHEVNASIAAANEKQLLILESLFNKR